jgi:hypothetical protein
MDKEQSKRMRMGSKVVHNLNGFSYLSSAWPSLHSNGYDVRRYASGCIMQQHEQVQEVEIAIYEGLDYLNVR